MIHVKNFNTEVLCGNTSCIAYVLDSHEELYVKTVLCTKYFKCNFKILDTFISKDHILVTNGHGKGLLIEIGTPYYTKINELDYEIIHLTYGGVLVFGDRENFYTISVNDYKNSNDDYDLFPRKNAISYYPDFEIYYYYLDLDRRKYIGNENSIEFQKELFLVDDKYFIGYKGLNLFIYDSKLNLIKEIIFDNISTIVCCYVDKNCINIWFSYINEKMTAKLYQFEL